ncbi:hypothetical protein FIBSPDRAFT_727313 [Athelia psychrophila]|uniref:Chromo domain-containing protein n=1 Tax=Athelia psychrophila TaxID=1759441 RepID=A0A166SKG1_9AGAM|nr:hypothetical protein FIBSPDRAFT_727313 [Fibularhizoctonia sp. CBS 109695]
MSPTCSLVGCVLTPAPSSRWRERLNEYLVRWVGEGPGDDLWLPARELQDCEALDVWLDAKGRL